MTTINEKSKITLAMLVPLAGVLVLAAQDHAALGELRDRQDKLETLVTDVAVIKSQVIDINHKLDKENE